MKSNFLHLINCFFFPHPTESFGCVQVACNVSSIASLLEHDRVSVADVLTLNKARPEMLMLCCWCIYRIVLLGFSEPTRPIPIFLRLRYVLVDLVEVTWVALIPTCCWKMLNTSPETTQQSPTREGAVGSQPSTARWDLQGVPRGGQGQHQQQRQQQRHRKCHQQRHRNATKVQNVKK